MKFGISITSSYKEQPGDEGLAFIKGCQDRLDLARLARDVGFKVVTMGQHFLSPPPPHYMPSTIPFLARVAAEGDLELMTSILLMPLYHPAELAEEVATLDCICNGKFTLAIGIGYRPKEFEIFGTRKQDRVARTEECIHILKALWSQDVVDFKGKHFTIPHVGMRGKPVQKGGPPILLGTGARAGAIRAARMADGLYVGGYATMSMMVEQRQLYREKLQEFGKPVEQGIFHIRREVYWDANKQRAKERALPAIRRIVQGYKEHGLEGSIMPDHLMNMGPNDTDVELPFLLGNGQEIAEQVTEYKTRLDLTFMNLGFNVSGLAHTEVMRTVERFGKEVIPHFKN